MRVKVELHPNVAWSLRHQFTREEVDEFYKRLHQLREAPLRHSEPTADPAKGGQALRFFRFGKGVEKIAVFKYDIARNRITVMECRPFKPKRMRKPNGNNGGKAARGPGGSRRPR